MKAIDWIMQCPPDTPNPASLLGFDMSLDAIYTLSQQISSTLLTPALSHDHMYIAYPTDTTQSAPFLQLKPISDQPVKSPDPSIPQLKSISN